MIAYTNAKKFLISSAIAFSLVLGVAYAAVQYTQTSESTKSPFGTLAAQYEADFSAQENALIQKMLTLIKVTPAQWKKEFAAYEKNQRKKFSKEQSKHAALADGRTTKTALPKELVERTYCLLREQGIKENTVAVLPGASMSTNGYCLWICEDELRECPFAQEASILHEITHIKNKDAYVEGCLLALYDRHEPTTAKARKQWKDYLRQLSYLQEERADTMAGLVSVGHAKATAEDFEQWLQEDDTEYPTHPKNSDRLAYMNNLLDKMHAEQLTQQSTGVLDYIRTAAAAVAPSFVMTA